MSDEKTISEQLETQTNVCSWLSEGVTVIDSSLVPVKQLKKLSKSGVLDQSTFAALDINALAEITFSLVTTLQTCKSTLKTARKALEDLDDIVITSSDNTSHLEAQISDIQTKLDNFVTTPTPDWTKVDFTTPLTEAATKLQSPVNLEVKSRQISEEQLRSNNLIIYNIAYDKNKPTMALDYARDYFNSCGITSYYLEQTKIVDAQFLKVSEDQMTCSLRVIMSNQWVVRTLLRDACKLKNSDSTSYRGQSFDFSKTYISKDMTKSEQDEHKVLILELKESIRKDPSTRWIIRYGRVQAWGKFQKC